MSKRKTALLVMGLGLIILGAVIYNGQEYTYRVTNYISTGRGNLREFSFGSLDGRMEEGAVVSTAATLLVIDAHLGEGALKITVKDPSGRTVFADELGSVLNVQISGDFPPGRYQIIWEGHRARAGKIRLEFR